MEISLHRELISKANCYEALGRLNGEQISLAALSTYGIESLGKSISASGFVASKLQTAWKFVTQFRTNFLRPNFLSFSVMFQSKDFFSEAGREAHSKFV